MVNEQQHNEHRCYRFGNFMVDRARRELIRDGQPVGLARTVFEGLLHLIEHRDRAVGRDELVQAAYCRTNVSDAQLGQLILRMRRAVDDDGHEQRVVRTIARFGFRWQAEIEEVAVAEDSVDSGSADVPLPSRQSAATKSSTLFLVWVVSAAALLPRARSA